MPRYQERPPPDAGGQEPHPGSGVLVWPMPRLIARTDIPALCDGLGLALRRHANAGIVVCDLAAVSTPDTVVIEALARLKLTTLRLGRRMYLDRVTAEVQILLAMTGLADFLPLYGDLRVQPRWQTEEREDSLGVQERVEPGDPAV